MKEASSRTAQSPTSRSEKHVWEFKGTTFVFTTKRGCSGRNISPRELTDLLVSLMQS